MGTFCGQVCGTTYGEICSYTTCGDCPAPCKSNCQGFCLAGSSEYCLAISQHASNPGIPTIKRDDIIIKKLPKDKVQAIMDYLYEASKDGSTSQSGPKSATVNGGDFLKASDINQILAQLKTLNDCVPGADFSRDQIIYGSEINAIMDLIRSAKVDSSSCSGGPACNKCNAKCNSCVTCNCCS